MPRLQVSNCWVTADQKLVGQRHVEGLEIRLTESDGIGEDGEVDKFIHYERVFELYYRYVSWVITRRVAPRRGVWSDLELSPEEPEQN